jgi:hypothetical protein
LQSEPAQRIKSSAFLPADSMPPCGKMPPGKLSRRVKQLPECLQGSALSSFDTAERQN